MYKDALHLEELAKVAPEGHRPPKKFIDSKVAVWCPWAYQDVVVQVNYNDWPICSGCMRPVDLEKAGAV